MRTMIVVVAVLGMMGCGPSFDGTFSGTLSEATICDNGQAVSSQTTTTIELQQNGSTLAIVTTDGCAPFPATIAGNVATIQRKECPPQFVNGLSVNSIITGNRVTLTPDGDAQIDLRLDEVVSDGARSVGCVFSSTGVMIRETRR